ncbi:MAG: phosphoglucosamine mutase [Planctomycetota bacterium]|nr:phosphoglucosamine mutase [Planctomycetota bacterium]
MSERLFGTDGIRGRAGEGPLRPEFLRRLGKVLGARLACGAATPRVVIGHDGRASGPEIVEALSAGLAAAGCSSDAVGLCTTPSLAFIAATGDYGAGVMVSASHNPAEDNGVKLFGADGAKWADAGEAELEAALQGDSPPDARAPGTTRSTPQQLDRYVAWLRSAFPELALQGRRVLVDCAHGGASQLAPRVLQAFGAAPVLVNHQPDGTNINRDCGALHPEAAAAEARARNCEIGVSLDGDADRGILFDGGGRILDGDALLAGLGAHALGRDEIPQRTVVATVMSNLALERWLEERGGVLLRAQVGDRFVAEAMRSGGYTLGGEKSGHLLFGDDHGWRGDGLYTLLRVLRAQQRDGQTPADFARDYSDWPQTLVNLRVLRRVPLERLPHLQREVSALDRELHGSGRTVVRFSGTELKLRLMVEARDQRSVDESIRRLDAAARADGIVQD